jgi:hypothetical protein
VASSRALSEEAASDRLIAHYLRQLRVAAWIRQLPRAETTALQNEVASTIASELAAAGNREEATVYGVLDRLGPAGDIVARHGAAPPTGLRRAVVTVLAPVTRLQAILRSRGWGVAEIGGLFLLILGPFYLWWLGPFFGISLVRVGADRWTHRATHIATVVVVVLFAVQALMALAIFALVMLKGGSAADELQLIISHWLGGLPRSGLPPPGSADGGLGVLSLVDWLLIAPAPLAGLLSGVYLALSPRHRP